MVVDLTVRDIMVELVEGIGDCVHNAVMDAARWQTSDQMTSIEYIAHKREQADDFVARPDVIAATTIFVERLQEIGRRNDERDTRGS